jgi:hypothetical protein
MPAFRGQITEEELRALGVYIGWLRASVPGSGRRLAVADGGDGP